MDPRFSFSRDFLSAGDDHAAAYREAPVSSDFAFSVKHYSMIPADEIFSQGKMVPLRRVTLREELLAEEVDGDDSKEVKGSVWWKEKLRFKKGLFPPGKRDEEEDGRADVAKAWASACRVAVEIAGNKNSC